jgi:hypothetical protein
VFESRFESGNLSYAAKVSESEYNLLLQNDVNSKGHIQWFYFRVTNTTADLKVKFNILNFAKTDSLFNYGMKVLVYSETENREQGTGWFRAGEDILYFANGIRRDDTMKSYYSLTFTYTFQHSSDTVFFAYCFPYTYYDLMQDLNAIESDPGRSMFVTRKLLCYTLGGNRCEYLTVTSPAHPDVIKHRKGIVISARVHPGETVGSWMMKGIIDFITGPSSEAETLRNNYIFKIVPMLNPDGVINGNYRCSLAGVDLNRRWSRPSKTLHPEITATKKLVKQFSRERQIDLVCDLHGHSRKKNIFMYGCNIHNQPEATRLLPYILSKISPLFSFKDCRFAMQKSKESTMRITIFKETHIKNVFTLEASFCGMDFGPYAAIHFTTSHLQDMGKHLCLSLLVYSNLQVGPAPEPQPGPLSESAGFQHLSKSQLEQELRLKPELLITGDTDSDSGSDSEPSEDNLDSDTIKELIPFTAKSKEKKTSKRRTASLRASPPRMRAPRPPKTCPNCGEQVTTSTHECPPPPPKPKFKARPMPRPLSKTVGLNTYYNAAGKKVHDQATQTNLTSLKPPSSRHQQQRETRSLPSTSPSPHKKQPSISTHIQDTTLPSAFSKYPGVRAKNALSNDTYRGFDKSRKMISISNTRNLGFKMPDNILKKL